MKVQSSKFKVQTLKGFTLLEVLVSVGIIALITVAISQAFLVTTRTNTKTNLINTIKQNGDYGLEYMLRVIRGASDVVSTCNGTSIMTFIVKNSDASTTKFSCSSDGISARITTVHNDEVPQFLTGNTLSLTTNPPTDSVTCNSSLLAFTCTSSPGEPIRRVVNISFTLRQKGTSGNIIDNAWVPFQSTVTLRN